MPHISIGTQPVDVLAPDLGLLLAAEMETWPSELRENDAIRWIRAYRDKWNQWRRTIAPAVSQSASDPVIRDTQFEMLAPNALIAAHLWRLDLCVKLIIHIGWQWTTATQLLEEINEALTPAQLEHAASLAHEQFQQRYDQRQPSPDASEQPRSLVLQATSDQLKAALTSIYAKSRDYHTQRLTQAQSWWTSWSQEVRLLRWQANLVDRLGRSVLNRLPDNDDTFGEVYEILQTLEHLCQPPALFTRMQRDDVDPEELLAPDPYLWPPMLAHHVARFLSALLKESDAHRQRDTISYWLLHSSLPEAVTSSLIDSAAQTNAPTEAADAAIVGEEPEDFSTRHSALSIAQTWYAEGFTLAHRGHFVEALEAYDKALAIHENDDVVWYNKGLILAQLGRNQEALASFDRALAIRPNDAAFLRNKGRELALLDRNQEALAALDESLKHDPYSASAWHWKAVTLRQMGRLQEARHAIDRALDRISDQFASEKAAIWREKGLVLHALGHLNEAIASFDRAHALAPSDAASTLNKVMALAELGRHDEALPLCDNVLAAYPDDAAAWSIRAYILLGLRRYNDVLAASDHAIETDPSNASAWNARAYAFLRMNRLTEALTAIDPALEIEPHNANWWDTKGEILETLGRYREALSAYNTALHFNSTLATSYQGKARALKALQARHMAGTTANTFAMSEAPQVSPTYYAAAAQSAYASAAAEEPNQPNDYPAQSNLEFES